MPEYASEQKNETAGINIFVYCCNDAVNNADIDGHKKKKKKAIIYTVEEFMDESKAVGKNLEKYFKKKIKVYFRTIDNSNDFNNLREKWNNTGKCDIAIINCHASKDYENDGFYRMNGLNRFDVLDLKPKKVKVLILLACFAGNLSNNDGDTTFINVASSFANIISVGGVVVASNGIVKVVKHKLKVTRHFYAQGRAIGWSIYERYENYIVWHPTSLRIITIKKILNYIKDKGYGTF